MKLLILSSLFVLCVVVNVKVEAEQVAVAQPETVAAVPVVKSTQDPGCICYEIFDPICANNDQSYTNACFLKCAMRQNPYLFGVCKGECPCCKPPYENEPIEETGWGMPMGGGPPSPYSMGPPSPYPYYSKESPPHLVTKPANGDEMEKEKDAKLGWSPNTDCFCTAIYRPVCGSNNQTFGNLCELKCAAKASGDTCLTEVCDGECPCCSCSSTVVYAQKN